MGELKIFGSALSAGLCSALICAYVWFVVRTFRIMQRCDELRYLVMKLTETTTIAEVKEIEDKCIEIGRKHLSQYGADATFCHCYKVIELCQERYSKMLHKKYYGDDDSRAE